LRHASDPRLEAFVRCARELTTHLNGGHRRR